MKLNWWKLNMSCYHTVYPSWDGPAVVCHLFLYLLICAPTTANKATNTATTFTMQSNYGAEMFWIKEQIKLALQCGNCLSKLLEDDKLLV